MAEKISGKKIKHPEDLLTDFSEVEEDAFIEILVAH